MSTLKSYGVCVCVRARFVNNGLAVVFLGCGET